MGVDSKTDSLPKRPQTEKEVDSENCSTLSSGVVIHSLAGEREKGALYKGYVGDTGSYYV